MNPYMVKYFETTIEPRICRIWEMGNVYPEFPLSKLNTNTNPQIFNFDTQYNLTSTFGKKYVNIPELYFSKYNKLITKYSLDKFIDMMNFQEDAIYSDDNGKFTFSECQDYGLMQGDIYDAISKRGYSDNITAPFAFTRLYYVNVVSSRNVIACLDDVDCIINYCRNGGKKWQYSTDRQVCEYSNDGILSDSDSHMFFGK